MGKVGEKYKFRDTIKGTLKKATEVSDLKQMATLEIQDLDVLSTTEEVLTAINKATEIPVNELTVNLADPNKREQKRAFVSLSNTAKKQKDALGVLALVIYNGIVKALIEKECD